MLFYIHTVLPENTIYAKSLHPVRSREWEKKTVEIEVSSN